MPFSKHFLAPGVVVGLFPRLVDLIRLFPLAPRLENLAPIDGLLELVPAALAALDLLIRLPGAAGVVVSALGAVVGRDVRTLAVVRSRLDRDSHR